MKQHHGARDMVTASDGDEAISTITQFVGRIDVLLTDVILPGKNGKQVAEEVLQRRPEMKVAYMSGYTPNAIVHCGALDEGVNFLQKPFTGAQLIALLRSVMVTEARPRVRNREVKRW